MAKAFVATHVVVDTGRKYSTFVSAMESLLGKHDLSAYQDFLNPAEASKVAEIVEGQSGPYGLMIFSKLPVGMLFSIEGRSVDACQYTIGNPLTAFSMMRHDIRAGLYAPLRVLVHADAEGNATVEYDLPSSLFGSIDNRSIDSVALSLDEKLASLIEAASHIDE